MRPASIQRLDAERTGKCRHRLSKTLGKDEVPGDRGDCEPESSTQGSELETPPQLSRPKR